jgi:hypothetical protein
MHWLYFEKRKYAQSIGSFVSAKRSASETQMRPEPGLLFLKNDPTEIFFHFLILLLTYDHN